MKQKQMIWTSVTVIAVGLSIYLVKKKIERNRAQERNRLLLYSRGKMYGGGEFVL